MQNYRKRNEKIYNSILLDFYENNFYYYYVLCIIKRNRIKTLHSFYICLITV